MNTVELSYISMSRGDPLACLCVTDARGNRYMIRPTMTAELKAAIDNFCREIVPFCDPMELKQPTIQ